MLYYLVTITNHPQFISFLKDLREAYDKKYNVAIISLPGSGVTFYIKKIIELGEMPGVSYITNSTQPLLGYNFIDLDFNKNPDAIKIVQNFLKNCLPSQKFAIVVNTPQILDDPQFLNSSIPEHIFKFIYMPQMDQERAKILAHNSSIDINEDKLSQIVKITGGIARLVKYFLLNPEKISNNIQDLIQNKEFFSIFNSTIDSIKICNIQELTKLGIIKDGQYISTLVKDYLDSDLSLKIKLLPNGSIEENKQLSSSKFLKHELAIIDRSLKNNGTITKEEISDIRWGKDSYQNYSDQAIKKIIQRINQKLSQHIFTAIPTIGYQLTNKHV